MKERLTGAIILVVLIVLLVPELLSGPSRTAPAPQTAAASSEEPPLRSYTINLADESHPTAASASGSNVSPQSSSPVQPAPIVELPEAQQTTTGASTESSPEQTEDSPQPSPAATTGSQEVPREQSQPVPPYEQSPTASPLAGQHYAAPGKPATAERASEMAKASPTGEWMVQLGVFRSHANAERLAQQLKEQGFHVLVSESVAGGHPLWRVRAGPLAERASAEQLGARLRTEGHAGSIVPK